jgi:hypothetical protein
MRRMAGITLFDQQKHRLRQMVHAVEKGCRPGFTIFNNATFAGVLFEGANGVREQVECDPHDLVALHNEGLINLISRGSGTLVPQAIEAVRNNFAAPMASSRSTVIHIQGNVANIQSGDGNVAHVMQNVNPNLSEVLALIGECRNLIGSTDPCHAQTQEALTDLEAEVKSGSPKKSRALLFLQSASRYAVAGTALAKSLGALGKALHGWHF